MEVYCHMGVRYWNMGQDFEMKTYIDSSLWLAKTKQIPEKANAYATIWSYYNFYYNQTGDIRKFGFK